MENIIVITVGNYSRIVAMVGEPLESVTEIILVTPLVLYTYQISVNTSTGEKRRNFAVPPPPANNLSIEKILVTLYPPAPTRNSYREKHVHRCF